MPEEGRPAPATLFVYAIFAMLALPFIVDAVKLLSTTAYRMTQEALNTTKTPDWLKPLVDLVSGLVSWLSAILYNQYAIAALLFIGILLLAIQGGWK